MVAILLFSLFALISSGVVTNLLYGLRVKPDCSDDVPQRFYPSGFCVKSRFFDEGKSGFVEIMCNQTTGEVEIKANCSSCGGSCDVMDTFVADDSCKSAGLWPMAKYHCVELSLGGERFWRDVYDSTTSCGNPTNMQVRLVETATTVAECRNSTSTGGHPSVKIGCRTGALKWDTFMYDNCSGANDVDVVVPQTCLDGQVFADTKVRYGGCATCLSVQAAAPGVCQGHGVCGEDSTCDCMTGYMFNNCSWTCDSISSEDVDVCSMAGDCVALDACVCDSLYYGDTCDDYDCFGFSHMNSSVCGHGNGVCNGPDDCQCRPQFMAPDCVNAHLFDLGSEDTYYFIVSALVVAIALAVATFLCVLACIVVCCVTYHGDSELLVPDGEAETELLGSG